MFLVLSVIYLRLHSLTAETTCSDHNETRTQKNVTIPLNVIISSVLAPCSETAFSVVNLSSQYTHVVFHAHSQHYPFDVSLTRNKHYDETVSGSDKGVLTLLGRGQDEVTWYINCSQSVGVKIWLVAVPYMQNEPVPGGCSLEFPLAQDPNIHLTYDPYATTLSFQYSTKDRGRGRRLTCPPGDALTYKVYVYYLPGNDRSQESYGEAISKMMKPRDVMTRGKQLLSLSGKKKTYLRVSSFPGQGAIYSIVAFLKEGNRTTLAMYTPVATYACDVLADGDSCKPMGGALGNVICTAAGLVGLLLCFFGHRFFKTELFVFGFLSVMLASYIPLSVGTDWTLLARILTAAGLGLVGGTFWLLLWCRYDKDIISVILVGLDLGYLFSSTLFFTPFGNIVYWQNNFNYGVTFSCGCLLLAAILLYFTKTLNIVSCSVIGSYGVVVAIDSYLGANLIFIVLYPIRRAVDPAYGLVIPSTPFQVKDLLLCLLWIVLAVIGAVTQFYTERKKDDFPTCPYKKWKQHGNPTQDITERKRLLGDNSSVNYGSSNRGVHVGIRTHANEIT